VKETVMEVTGAERGADLAGIVSPSGLRQKH
jgi:hypothetical protein